MRRRRFVVTAAAALGAAAFAPVRAAAPAEVSFPTAGGSLAYRRFGASGPVLVFLSGGPGLRSTYLDPIAQTLAADHATIVFDQRGTGASRDAYGDGSLVTVAGFVADLDALRSALGLGRLALVGHSWGAMLAMAYAAAHPERVASLALLDPGGPSMQFYPDFARRLREHLTDDERLAVGAALEAGKLPPPAAITPGYFHDHAKGVAFARTPDATTVYANVATAIGRDAPAHYAVSAALQGTTIPAFTLYGSDDVSLAAKPALDALFPHATTSLVPNAGHFPWLENPVPFYAGLEAFEGSVPPAA